MTGKFLRAFWNARPSRPRRANLEIEKLEERELLTTASDGLVGGIFRDLHLSPPEPAQRSYWSSLLDQQVPVAEVVRRIEATPAYRNQQATETYAALVGTAPSPRQLAQALRLLDRGGVERLSARVLGSPLFYRQHGGTPARFLRALGRKVLGRPLDPATAAALSQQLAAGETREHVARTVLDSAAARKKVAQSLVAQFLGRAGDPRTVRSYAALLGQGRGRERLVAVLIGAPEYLARYLTPPPVTGPRGDVLPPTVTLTDATDGRTRSNVTVTGRVTDDLSGVALLEAQLDNAPFAPLAADAAGGFQFRTTLPLDGSGDGPHTLRFRAADRAGNRSAERAVTFTLDTQDPAADAAPTDMTVATTVGAATQFLYTGPNPVQTGVAAGTIDPARAAVLRGRVTDRAGQPLAEVRVSSLNHPEYGQTRTRNDGMFDLAVNGGDAVLLQFARDGYLPAQRSAAAPWQDFTWLPDVTLVPLDPQATMIDLRAGMPMQAARGGVMADDDGTRQATLLFPAGTQAEMVLPDQRRVPLTTLHVRATEYTVGSNGPQAMPGPLPASSGYTYAVELSADEAMTAGATEVRFNRPVPFYVENFLGFPVGGAVPAGYYDRQSQTWVASDNGRIIAVLGAAGGLAELDTDGDAVADDAAALAALGIDDAERGQLAGLYAAGTSLWRVPIPHFTPWDMNWPYGPPPDAEPPDVPVPQTSPNDPDSCQEQGSIIDVHNQVLGERLPIADTPFTLNYRSDRVQGRAAATNTLTIPLSGATLPASVTRIDLEIRVAGTMFQRSFAPAADLSFAYTWDGRDAYGRPVQGTQPVTVRVGYAYQAFRYYSPATFDQAFARVSGSGPGAVRQVLRDFTREEVVLWSEMNSTLASGPRVGVLDAHALGLGGWTLDAHHVYTPADQTLYLGDGRHRSARDVGQVITTFANAGVGTPAGIATAADGTVYVSGGSGFAGSANKILRLDPSGTVTPIAGDGLAGFNGDSEASVTRFNDPEGIAAGSGGTVTVTVPREGGGTETRTVPRPILYVADSGNHRIRELRPSGGLLFVHTVAGSGTAGFDPGIPGFGADEIPATSARLNMPTGVAYGPDGSLYIVDTGNQRIRQVTPDGTIHTLAGTGTAGFAGDGGVATQAQLNAPRNGIVVAPDGSVYFSDTGNHRVRRIAADGTITTVAGTGVAALSPDGGPATQAALFTPTGLALDADGNLYIAELDAHRIRKVDPAGVIATVAGMPGSPGISGDSGPALEARLNFPLAVGFAPDGDLVLTHVGGSVRRVGMDRPGTLTSDLLVPEADGSVVYRFSRDGRHLETRHALTGAVLYQFAYDAAGRLTAVTDADANVTTVERDAAGNPTAIVSPSGRRTELRLNAAGYLETVTNPAGEAVRLEYDANGLLTRETAPGGGVHRFEYNAEGRLIRDEGPDGNFTTLSLNQIPGGYEVVTTDALGRMNRYQTVPLVFGAQLRTHIRPDGTQVVEQLDTATHRTMTDADGTVVVQVTAPDPRWGMQAPLLAQQTVLTPNGPVMQMTTSRTVALADANPLNLASLVDTTVINGRTYIAAYDAATRQFTYTSPESRQTVARISPAGELEFSAVTGLAPYEIVRDGRGRITTVTAGTGATARTDTFRYNLAGDLTGVTDPMGQPTDFAYDAAGRLVRQTFADGQIATATYDGDGNLTSVTPPGRPAHTFGYSLGGRLTRVTAPDAGSGAASTLYGYNAAGDLTSITGPDGAAISAAYDTAGRLATITLPNSQMSYTYDALTGQLVSVSAPNNTLAYTYAGGLLTSAMWSGVVQGSVGYTYDDDYRVTAVRVNGVPVAYQYDRDKLLTQAGGLILHRDPPSGRVIGTTLGGLTTANTFTPFGETDQFTATFGAATVFAVQHTYDDLGRVTHREETVGGVTDAVDYRYDGAGRLIEVRRNGTVVRGYTYDANGNRLSEITPTGTVTATYDAQDRLVRYGNAVYQYRADGTLQSVTENGQTTTYDYDPLGNLRSVTLPDGTQVEYLIDGADRRIGTRVNGVAVQKLLYEDDLRPAAELDGGDNVVSRFVYGTRANVPAYLEKGGVTYRLLTDQVGSVRLVVNAATGEVAQRLDYDAFGKVLTDTNPGFQPFGFAGGLYDARTGLLRFGARDYDPRTGRWTAPDPIGYAGGQPNLYAYVNSDPVNRTDPSGLGGESPPPEGFDQETDTYNKPNPLNEQKEKTPREKMEERLRRQRERERQQDKQDRRRRQKDQDYEEKIRPKKREIDWVTLLIIVCGSIVAVALGGGSGLQPRTAGGVGPTLDPGGVGPNRGGPQML